MAKKSKKAAVKKTSAKSSATKSKVKAKPKAVKATSKKAVAVKKSTQTPSAAVRKTPVLGTSARVIEYKLFTEDSVRSLEDQVNYLIKKGWAPVGGVVLQGQSTFTQTMVRHED